MSSPQRYGSGRKPLNRYSLAKIYLGTFATLRAQTLARMDEEINVRAYFDTHDFSLLQGKPFPQAIPYPDALFLRSMLDNPTTSNILPANLTGRRERLDSPVSEKMTKAMLALVPHMKKFALFDELSDKKLFAQSVSSGNCEGFIDAINGVFASSYSIIHGQHIVCRRMDDCFRSKRNRS